MADYLLNRQGVYYFKYTFPFNLNGLPSQIVKSLRTKNRLIAKSLISRKLLTINVLRTRNNMTKEELKKLYDELTDFTEIDQFRSQGEARGYSDYMDDALGVLADKLDDTNYSDRDDPIAINTGDAVKYIQSEFKLLADHKEVNHQILSIVHLLLSIRSKYAITGKSADIVNELQNIKGEIASTELQTVDEYFGSPTRPASEAKPSKKLKELFESYLAQRVKDNDTPEDYIKRTKRGFTYFCNHIPEDSNIYEITPSQVYEATENLLNQESYSKYKGFGREEYLERVTGQVNQGMAEGTVKRYLDNFSGMFEHGINHLGLSLTNPTIPAKKLVNNKTSRDPYTEKELTTKILPCLKSSKDTDFRWLCLLAMYTGARRGELAGLTPESFTFSDEFSYFHIKEGKTEYAERYVMISEELLEVGLQDYIESKQAKNAIFRKDLFNGKKTVNQLLPEITDKPKNKKQKPKKKTFYCFRHSFMTYIQAKLAEKSLAYSVYMVGHSTKNRLGMASGYTDMTVLEPKEFKVLIPELHYPFKLKDYL